MNATEPVFDALQRVLFGLPMEFANLTIVPLLVTDDRDPDYRTLDEALASEHLQITEVSEAGAVPQLRAVNTGDEPVLLVDGEELVGAKQNRVLNLTILVPARQTVVIPVSCVEARRWRHTSPAFESSSRVQFAEGRARKMQDVTDSLECRRERASDQGAVWHLIDEKAARLDALSDTSAMAAMYDTLHESIDDFVKAFPPLERQVGAVLFVNGRVAGLELFDSAASWRKLAPKLLRSYALDAIDRRRMRARKFHVNQAAGLIRRLTSSRASAFAAVGEGEDVRLTGLRVAGAALVAHERAIHLSAFPVHAARDVH
jgi:hypothetical protein